MLLAELLSCGAPVPHSKGLVKGQDQTRYYGSVIHKPALLKMLSLRPAFGGWREIGFSPTVYHNCTEQGILTWIAH